MSLDPDQQISSAASSEPGNGVDSKRQEASDRTLSWYAAREPVVVLVLSAIAVGLFFLVGGLSQLYQKQLKSRGSAWFDRGVRDLEADRVQNAVADFQVALSYSRDNSGYQLRLAQALVALNRTEEARTYLMSLWQREPENGSVNLELARIYAEKEDIPRALRYYHNAIYAVWDGDAEKHQRSVRLELIKFLLDHKAFNQAESELIAVGRDLPDDPYPRLEIADSFMKIPDYDRALEQYHEVLEIDRHNRSALAGAGRAAFELGRFPLAEHYLSAALLLDPNDHETAGLLKMVREIPNIDVYEMSSTLERDRAVLAAFNTAGERLRACEVASSRKGSANASLEQLYSHWLDRKATLTDMTLREQADEVDTTMGFVFNIERQTSDICGTPTGTDLMLLLIGRHHQGS